MTTQDVNIIFKEERKKQNKQIADTKKERKAAEKAGQKGKASKLLTQENQLIKERLPITKSLSKQTAKADTSKESRTKRIRNLQRKMYADEELSNRVREQMGKSINSDGKISKRIGKEKLEALDTSIFRNKKLMGNEQKVNDMANQRNTLGLKSNKIQKGTLFQQEQVLNTQKATQKQLKTNMNLTTAWGMGFLSIMFFGQMLQKQLSGMFRSSFNAFKQVTAGSKDFNKTLTIIEANMTYLKFSFANALLDVMAPAMENLGRIIEGLSDWIQSNPMFASIIMGGALAIAMIMSLGSQIALLYMSMLNFSTIKKIRIGIDGAAMAASGTAAGSMAGMAAGTAAGKKFGKNLIPGVKAGLLVAWDKIKLWGLYIAGFTKAVAIRIGTMFTTVGAAIGSSFVAGAATAIAALLLLGYFTNKYNDQIEKATENTGVFGQKVNIISDALAIAWSSVVIFAKQYIDILAQIAKGMFDALLFPMEQLYKIGSKIASSVFGAEWPALDGIVSNMESVREETDAAAKSLSWFESFNAPEEVTSSISPYASAQLPMSSGVADLQLQQDRTLYIKEIAELEKAQVDNKSDFLETMDDKGSSLKDYNLILDDDTIPALQSVEDLENTSVENSVEVINVIDSKKESTKELADETERLAEAKFKVIKSEMKNNTDFAYGLVEQSQSSEWHG